jgi:hypothetical protein
MRPLGRRHARGSLRLAGRTTAHPPEARTLRPARRRATASRGSDGSKMRRQR